MVLLLVAWQAHGRVWQELSFFARLEQKGPRSSQWGKLERFILLSNLLYSHKSTVKNVAMFISWQGIDWHMSCMIYSGWLYYSNITAVSIVAELLWSMQPIGDLLYAPNTSHYPFDFPLLLLSLFQRHVDHPLLSIIVIGVIHKKSAHLWGGNKQSTILCHA